MSSKKETQENGRHWEFVDETSQRVKSWPEWKKAAAAQTTSVNDPPMRPSTKNEKAP